MTSSTANLHSWYDLWFLNKPIILPLSSLGQFDPDLNLTIKFIFLMLKLSRYGFKTYDPPKEQYIDIFLFFKQSPFHQFKKSLCSILLVFTSHSRIPRGVKLKSHSCCKFNFSFSKIYNIQEKSVLPT